MKHLLNIQTDSDAIYKEHDVTYYNSNNGKVFSKKHYDEPFIKIFMDKCYHDTSIIPLKARKYGNIPENINWTHNLGNKAVVENGVLRFVEHYEGEIIVTATAGEKSATHVATIDCTELPTSYTYNITNVQLSTVNWNDTSATINFTYEISENYPLKPSKITSTPQSVIVHFPENNPKLDYTTGDEYVDLGLPSGLKWGKCNIGAKTEEERGILFQYGDTEGFNGEQYTEGMYMEDFVMWANPTIFREGTFDFEGVKDTPYVVRHLGKIKLFEWVEYKYCEGTYNTLTKYNTDTNYGIVDNKTELDPIDDAVAQYIGGDKRMPTKDNYQELVSNCCWVTMPGGPHNIKRVVDGVETIVTVYFPAGFFAFKAKDPADKGKIKYDSESTYSPDAHYEGDTIVDGDPYIFFPMPLYVSHGLKIGMYCAKDINSTFPYTNYQLSITYEGAMFDVYHTSSMKSCPQFIRPICQ